MDNHGHKTDGRAHVLNSLSKHKNTRGAQGKKILCLSFIALFSGLGGLIVGAGSSQAQASDIMNRLQRMENEVETLNRAVYKGERPSAPTAIPSSQVYNTPITRGAVSADTTAQMEIRLQQMETQVRELTGRVEQQVYDINLLKQELHNLKLSGEEEAKAKSARAADNPLNLNFKPPEIKGMKTAVPGGGSVDPTAQYEQAYASLKSEKYAIAQKGFESFLVDNSDHVLAANAKYWLGETYYVRGDYKQSARVFAEGFQAYPESAKSPDILLKLGMSLAGMGKKKDACVALSQLPVKFTNGSETVLLRAEQEMKKIGCSR